MTKILLFALLSIFAACGDSHIVNDPDSSFDASMPGCPLYFASEKLCLDMSWEVMPTENTVGSMILTFTDNNDPTMLVTPQKEPFVVLWMTSMGHGSSPVTMEYLDTGRFRVNDVFFIMPGPWDLKFQLKDGDFVAEERVRGIDV